MNTHAVPPAPGDVAPVEIADASRVATPLEAILPEVLGRLDWQRREEVFASALPRQDGLSSLDDAALGLGLLGISATVHRTVPPSWKDGLDGALVAVGRKGAFAIVRSHGEVSCLSDVEATEVKIAARVRGASRLMHVRRLSAEDANTVTVRAIDERIARGIRFGLLLSFLINAIAVTIPFFTMAIYDRVLGASAPKSLLPLILGGAIAVAVILVLRRMRARFLAAEHARLSAAITSAMETRLLRLPFGSLQRQSVEGLEGRVRGATRAADVFASANTNALFDGPFVPISVAAIAFVGGLMVLIPAIYLAMFLLVGWLLARPAQHLEPEIAKATTERAALLSDLGEHAADIRATGGAADWLRRFAEVSQRAAKASYGAGARSAAVQSIGYLLGTGAALATLSIGVGLALEGAILPGVLIGTMLLVWRITGPAQAFFFGLPRLIGVRHSMVNLRKSFAIATVAAPDVVREPFPDVAPAVECQGVFFRYLPDMDPALTGVSFRVEPGQTTVIMGPNGAGKSTLLRVLAGLLQPQSGRVLVNGRDLHQYDPDEVVLLSGYVPSAAQYALWHPEAFAAGASGLRSGASGTWSAADALASAVASVERRAHWFVDGEQPRSLGSGKRQPSIYLLDDPLAFADEAATAAFLAFLEANRGRATIFLTTHDVSLVPMADNALILDKGGVAFFGPVPKEAEQAAEPKMVLA
ncbi:ATP-binding cassette domain-containing protein [Acuticoccus sp. MNP-M23]|uniref:ATP-binding cassette domain-containing protein n=1 Tax=Acuticoccus sp. MNP-M23 TaxID=3072793 RepID=UPI0028168B51|nr:ATP-binding cassette domain-containing protein [Acuticoccus sp. MNP-M23]WMS41325.1 ATP-binding cassette domain-containing protein [Acuticoccus sp. MNP-M23]